MLFSNGKTYKPQQLLHTKIVELQNIPLQSLQMRKWQCRNIAATVTTKKKLWCWKCAEGPAACRKRWWWGHCRSRWPPGVKLGSSILDSWSSSLGQAVWARWLDTSGRWCWRCERSAWWPREDSPLRTRNRRSRSQSGLCRGTDWPKIWKLKRLQSSVKLQEKVIFMFPYFCNYFCPLKVINTFTCIYVLFRYNL